MGEEKEWIILYANKKVNEQFADYFIFGHRHLPMTLPLKNNPKALYINLGDWIQYFTFGILTSSGFELNSFSQADLSEPFLPKPNHGV